MERDIIPNISIDCALFGFEEGVLKVLLIRRKKEPANHQWSLPGGHIFMEEDVDEAARRILKELTGISNLFLSQVGLFGAKDRYPERRVISILYCALVQPDHFDLIAGAHAERVSWNAVQDLKLPFDHNKMIDTALVWLKEAIWQKPVFIHLLPEKFPLNQMQEVYEAFLQEPIDNRNFRKKVISQGLVERLAEKTKGGKQRPAYLYRLKERNNN